MLPLLRAYHEDPATLHIGCEPPAAYLMPFDSPAAAREGLRGASRFFRSLCGDWNFRYFPSLCRMGGVPALGAVPVEEERLPVPMSWQYALGRGFDTSIRNTPFRSIRLMFRRTTRWESMSERFSAAEHPESGRG